MGLNRLRNDAGSASVYFVVVAVGLLALAGMIYDGSSKVRATHQTNLAALEAARAASQELTGDAIAGRTSTVDPSRGAAAARAYLRRTGHEGTVTVSGTTVTVTTTGSWSPTFTPFIKGGTVTGTASASPEQVGPS
ncbi:MAG: hypothetical protein L0H31_10840 [Nocardioidaceae bacterium]|nr:hypothetical protein [Nocardioidaceae bacterium]